MIPAIPRQVVVEMARRRCRFHHYLWHRIRNTWLRLTEGERRAVHDINPEWAPPRPALDAARRPLRDNDSGEDFLFLHRRMIALANEILAGKGDPAYPRVEGWRRVPPPLDADYPVPEFPESELEEVKSADYFSQVVEPWEMRYNDHDYLKSVRLGQLGSDLESTIHCAMHVRWAAPSPVGYRPPNLFEDGISRRWDAPTYDYLGDTYSSHVNPLFWKIHGWVDERVRDWQRAHGRAGDIEWKGTWMGPAAHHAHLDAARRGAPATNDAVAEDMNRIDRILSASAAGGFDGFFRPPARPNHPTMPVPRRRE